MSATCVAVACSWGSSWWRIAPASSRSILGLRLHARIKTAALERGLLCYAMGGTIDGRLGDHLLLAPPFIVTDDDLGMIVARLGDAIDAGLDAARVGT